METLLNCVWLALGVALIIAWSAHACSTRETQPGQLLPSRRLQFTALLMLVILLFPVISLTDDIAMSSAALDAERALRLHDSVDGARPTQAVLPSAMAWTDVLRLIWSSGPSRPIEQEASLILHLIGTSLPVDSRPPPANI